RPPARAPRRAGRQRRERVERQRIEGFGKRDGREVRVDLEEEGLGVPVENVAARAHGRVGVPRPVVEVAGDPRVAVQEKLYGGRKTPRSVMIAAISEAGVTSNAGLKTGDSSGAVCCAPTRRTSEASRSSIGMRAPDGSAGSIVENGAAM